MKNIYLVLAVAGAVIPYLFFFQFIQVEGGNISMFIDSLFVNGAAGGFSADLLFSSCVFWVFMYSETNKLNSPKPTVFIILNLTIGLSCALPAYFYCKTKYT